MKRILVLGIALLLLLNGYPQRLFNPQAYWSNRVKTLQQEVEEERSELNKLNEQLVFLKKEGYPPSKRASGVTFSKQEIQEFTAENYQDQKRLLKKIKSRTEALKDAQTHYVNSLQG